MRQIFVFDKYKKKIWDEYLSVIPEKTIDKYLNHEITRVVLTNVLVILVKDHK